MQESEFGWKPVGESNGFVVQKHWRATQERIEKFLSDTYFTDVNLRGRLYSCSTPLHNVVWCKSEERLSFDQAKSSLQSRGVNITDSLKGFKIGPAWSTHWFECTVAVPCEWKGKHVRLRWDSSSEAMVWVDGCPIQGLTGSSDSHQLRTDYTLTSCANGGERFVVYIEAAANGMFGAGGGGMINPPDPNREFPLVMAEIAVFEPEVYDLLMDLTVLYDLTKHLPSDNPRAHEALYTANKMINVCDPFDQSTFARCREIAAGYLRPVNLNTTLGQCCPECKCQIQPSHTIGEEEGARQVVHAMANCHIDSAWLWPYAETRRKCGRSWASTLQLMEKYPDFNFVCSQAQQLEWVKEDYPSLYTKIQAKVSSGQFIPAGGAWVEMDGNIPSGESFVRQFLVGQRFFKQEFGKYCEELWLPDTFGYSAQLPQIMRGAGIKYFLSQKLSWSLTNKFPHNSFIWEGLDGSQILAHFPPANTYESRADVKDILKTVDEMKDKGRTRDSVLLYGHGDGGGGPTDNMLESLKRMMDVEGCPRIKHSTPELFFSTVESKAQQNLCKWVGELYLELHRGTYTSQAKLKLENRRIEFLLHDVDFISAISRIVAAGENVASFQAEMCQLWKKFLLNQFHDVIPGSCIAQVVTDALELYKDVKAKALTIFHEQFNGIIEKIFQKSPVPTHTVVNSFCWERKEVVRIHDPTTAEATPRKRQKLMADESVVTEQILKDGSVLNYVVSPPMSIGELTKISPPFAASVIKLDDGDYLLENGILKARVRAGLLISLYHKESQREVIDSDKGAGNQFVMFDDIPLFWDAWDVMEYHLETRKVVGSPELSDVSIEEEGPLRAILKVKFAISERSNVTQEIILDAGCSYLKFSTEVSWHESHKFLKVEFPLNVRAHEAKYEVQFGHVSRPTHFNTSWDQARFEVCGHKWADLSEHDFGVALLNDCKYGYSTLDNVMRLSLLRSPKAPDGDCDMGSHTFSYAIIPHKGTLQDSGVIQQAYNFNYPLKPLPSFFTGPASSFLTIDNPAIIIETIKQPEDVSRGSCLVVRVYEAYGGHAAASLTCKGMYKYVRCNLLEQVESDATDYCHGSKIPLKMKPFQVESYIVYIDCGTENMNTT